MQTKMSSFSHQLWNTPENRDAHTMIERVRGGLDLFGRPTESYERIDDNLDVPEFIRTEYREHERFKYLLNRDDEHAAFEDWQAMLERN